jgi:hypothetical protein
VVAVVAVVMDRIGFISYTFLVRWRVYDSFEQVDAPLDREDNECCHDDEDRW